MAQIEWLPQIDPDLCNGCGLCIELCPTGALGWQKMALRPNPDTPGIAALIAPARCNYCATCESVCPTGAIELPYLICKRDNPSV